MARLEEVCEILDSKRVPITAKDRVAGPYPYYGANGVQDYVAEYIFDDELVLLAEDGGHFGSADKPIAYRVSGKCWVNNHAHVLKAKDCIDIDYLCYSLMFRDVSDIVNGATRQKLTQADMRKIEIPLLPIEEQKSVVAKISKVFELIALRKEQLAKLDQLVKSRFVELFGDVSDFVNITDIAHTYIGLVTTMTKHYCNNGTPLLFNSSIKSDKIVWDGTCLDTEFAEANKSRMHKTNDIVTVHTGDIGTSAVVGEELNNSLGFATIVTRINDISRYYPRFVSSFLNYGSGKEQLKKYSRDVRNNLNLKDFNRLMVPNVSALEQKRYVDFWEQTDKSKLAIQQSIDKLELLKKSLMQEYFG